MNEVDVVCLPRATEQSSSIIGLVSEDSPSAALHRGYLVTKRVEFLRVRHARQQAEWFRSPPTAPGALCVVKKTFTR
jgi:hypothetical protein